MHRVGYRIGAGEYNCTPPYHPDSAFPEMRFSARSSEKNEPYALLRDLFRQLGYDAEKFGTPDWNPLGCLIKPEQCVVLKPNFVLSANASGQSLFAVITHPSILRAIVDYVFIALRGRGRI